eukprot:gene17191-8257_t
MAEAGCPPAGGPPPPPLAQAAGVVEGMRLTKVGGAGVADKAAARAALRRAPPAGPVELRVGWEQARDWDQPLADFLKAGAKPIYIGFGSVTCSDPAALSRFVYDAILLVRRRAPGVRFAVQPGWAQLLRNLPPGLALPDGVIVAGRCPHDWLFPQCAGVVHHHRRSLRAPPAVRAERMQRRLQQEEGVARGVQAFHNLLDTFVGLKGGDRRRGHLGTMGVVTWENQSVPAWSDRTGWQSLPKEGFRLTPADANGEWRWAADWYVDEGHAWCGAEGWQGGGRFFVYAAGFHKETTHASWHTEGS